MSHIKNFICGQVTFQVQSLPLSCLNRLRQYQLTNIKIVGDTIIFSVSLVHSAAIKKLVNNFEHQMFENHNIFRGVNFLLNHMALVASAILATIAFFVADMGIYQVQVQCDDTSIIPAVYERLECLGVKKFMWKNQLQNYNLATDLVGNFNNIAHAHIRIAGNTLLVNLVSATNQIRKIKTNFYAQYDAVIKEITTYSGTALVTEGDVVKKGDLLVKDAYPDSVVVTGEVAFMNGEEISRLVIWLI